MNAEKQANKPAWSPIVLPFGAWVNQPMNSGKWLIPGLLPGKSIALVSGLPKQGFKTWLALWLSMMVASGRGYKSDKGGDWRKPSLPGTVLFFEEEGADISNKERLNKVGLGVLGESGNGGKHMTVVKKYLPLPHGMKDTDPDRPYDWETTIHTPDEPLFQHFMFSHAQGVKLDIRERLNTLLKMTKETEAKLVVFDALTYVFNGDENEKAVVAEVVDAIKEIRSLGATVMPLVHLRKDSGEDDDIDKDMRGHTMLRDCYDVHFGARRPKDRDIIMLHIRYRDGRRKRFEIFWHIPDEGDMGPVALDVATVEKAGPKKGGPAYTPAEYYTKLTRKGVLVGPEYAPSKFYGIWGVNPGKGQEIVGMLLEAGLVNVEGDKIRLVAKP